MKLISALVEEYRLKRFFTLTLDPDMIEGDPWTYIHHPWTKFRHRMKRRFTDWKFVAVLEKHKHRDVPHIHGFTDIWMHQKDWSRHWHECCGGSIVWVEMVKSPDLSEYVSKQLEVARYLGKDQLKAQYKVEKRYRTLWRSKNTKASFELTPEPAWSIIKERVYEESGEYSESWQRRLENGSKTERFWKNLEATRGSISE